MLDAAIDVSGGNVSQYKQNGTVVDGKEPLDHQSVGATNVSFIVGFLRDYFAPSLPAVRLRPPPRPQPPPPLF